MTAVEMAAVSQGWEMSKARQDEALDRIDKGVSRLGEMARNVQEEVSACLPPTCMQYPTFPWSIEWHALHYTLPWPIHSDGVVGQPFQV